MDDDLVPLKKKKKKHPSSSQVPVAAVCLGLLPTRPDLHHGNPTGYLPAQEIPLKV